VHTIDIGALHTNVGTMAESKNIYISASKAQRMRWDFEQEGLQQITTSRNVTDVGCYQC